MHDPKIHISRLEDARWNEGRDLRFEALKKEPTAFSSTFEEEANISAEEWINRNKNAFYAFDNNRLVGMIVTVNQSDPMTKHIAHIFGVYVKKSHREMRIGSMLIEHAILKLRENGEIVKVKLSVNSKQTAAVKLYEKHGFTMVGVQKKEFFFEGQFYDDLLMELHF